MVNGSEQRRWSEMGQRKEMTADNLVEYEMSGEAINKAEADRRLGRSKQ
jgi:hypothetical protein